MSGFNSLPLNRNDSPFRQIIRFQDNRGSGVLLKLGPSLSSFLTLLVLSSVIGVPFLCLFPFCQKKKEDNEKDSVFQIRAR